MVVPQLHQANSGCHVEENTQVIYQALYPLSNLDLPTHIIDGLGVEAMSYRDQPLPFDAVTAFLNSVGTGRILCR